MAKFSSPPAGPLAAGLESDFCRCWLEVLHVFQNFTPILTLLDEHTSNVIAASVIALSIWAVLLARLAYF